MGYVQLLLFNYSFTQRIERGFLYTVTNPQSDFTNPQSDFTNPQSDFTHPQSDFINPQSDFINPQSDFINPQSDSVQITVFFGKGMLAYGEFGSSTDLTMNGHLYFMQKEIKFYKVKLV